MAIKGKIVIISAIILLLYPALLSVKKDAAGNDDALTDTGWFFKASVHHPDMTIKIGEPAVILPGQPFPSVETDIPGRGIIEGEIASLKDRSVTRVIKAQTVSAGEKLKIEFEGEPAPGQYRIQLRMVSADGKPLSYDSFYFTVTDPDKLAKNQSLAVFPDDDGNLVYVSDYRGNRIPDFSHVGFMGGEVPVPQVPVRIALTAEPGDDSERIQAAIDKVSEMPPDKNGFRGAVLLKKGVYEIGSGIEIRSDGVVIRGEGQGETRELWLDPAEGLSLEQLRRKLEKREATILIATGSERRVAIRVTGAGGPEKEELSVSEITDIYVPVGATSFHIDNPGKFKPGDLIMVQRSGNDEWISAIGMDRIPGRPDGGTTVQWSAFHLEFENKITAVDGNLITLASPVVNAIEKQWGGGRIFRFRDPGRISLCGVENLRAISFWKTNKDGVDDTRHPDRFLLFDNIVNGWASGITLEHFYSISGAVSTGRNSNNITIENSSNLIADKSFYHGPGYDPSGRTFYETGVYTGRYGFNLTGQNALVIRCYAVNNRHAFTVGSRVTGPNAFVHCTGENSLTWSEPHHRWSVGGLYDNVHDMIAFINRLWMGTGHGWAGANYVAWNTSGLLACQQPPTAQNWAIGHIGEKSNGPFPEYGDDGYWECFGQNAEPASLYFRQLEERVVHANPDCPEL